MSLSSECVRLLDHVPLPRVLGILVAPIRAPSPVASPLSRLALPLFLRAGQYWWQRTGARRCQSCVVGSIAHLRKNITVPGSAIFLCLLDLPVRPMSRTIPRSRAARGGCDHAMSASP